jgi:hypothetical protein
MIKRKKKIRIMRRKLKTGKGEIVKKKVMKMRKCRKRKMRK